MSTIEELLEKWSDPYTREQFDADYARVVARICEKHGISESEVEGLIREHRYTHSAEDIEDEYIQITTMAHYAGWALPKTPTEESG